MATAVVARRRGDDFQSRLFWLKATALLDPRSSVVRVSYEKGPKGLDDIVVEYDSERAPPDHRGRRVCREYWQCKWHTTSGEFGYEDLMAPEFIGATKFSLLERIRDAYRTHANEDPGCRFKLITNWRVRTEDPLGALIRMDSGELDLDLLREGKTAKSRMGRVRMDWCEHLGLEAEQLVAVCGSMCIEQATDSLDALRERLDERLGYVRLKQEEPGTSQFLYDDLVIKLLGQGRIEFDHASFLEMCHDEGLIVGAPVSTSSGLTIGVRSFLHPFDNLEDRCESVLDLVPYFDGRYIRRTEDWEHAVRPSLEEFVGESARTSEALRLVLDAHASIAFAAGSILDLKSGRNVVVEQRTGGRHFWGMDDVPPSGSWPVLTANEETYDANAADLAVAVSLTHDVSKNVRNYVRSSMPSVGRLLELRAEAGPSRNFVKGGAHAAALADAVKEHVRSRLAEGSGGGPIHLFIAGPNAFVFFLGQQQRALGSVAVYEWDFEGRRGGTYSLGLVVGNDG